MNRFLPVLAGLLAITATALCAGLPLETESARLNPNNTFSLSAAAEFQTSREGTERATPLAFEYGLTNRLEVLVEPVFYTAIRPSKGANATGMGDLEVTLNYLMHREESTLPAIAIAGEVKVPTAKNMQIGTGKADYTGYLIASKRFRQFDTHVNLGYTIVGQPAGQTLNNLFSYAAAIEYRLSTTWDIVTEAYGNTSTLVETQDAVNGVGESTVTPEASGGELVGMVGGRYRVSAHFLFAFGVSYDNSNALLFVPGLEYRFR